MPCVADCKHQVLCSEVGAIEHVPGACLAHSYDNRLLCKACPGCRPDGYHPRSTGDRAALFSTSSFPSASLAVTTRRSRPRISIGWGAVPVERGSEQKAIMDQYRDGITSHGFFYRPSLLSSMISITRSSFSSFGGLFKG